MFKNRVSFAPNLDVEHRSFVAAIESDNDTPTYDEIISRDDKDKWFEAMQVEMNSLKKCGVWELIDQPYDTNIVDNKWVLRIKRKQNGEIDRYRARLVARGFSQEYGVDYSETYAPVASIHAIRLLLAYAASRNLIIRAFDVKTAFLYGELDERVVMEQPQGFIDDENKVWLLKKSLYGLKQSPRQWNIKFTQALVQMGLTQSKEDNCVFYSYDPQIIICIYVDDGIIFCESENQAEDILNKLRKEFDIHTVEPTSYLGFQIQYDSGKIKIHQSNYICKLLNKFNMMACKPASSPAAQEGDLTLERKKCQRGKARATRQ